MDDHEVQVAAVRERETTKGHHGLHCVRLKVRVDYFPQQGELDFSLIAWEQPQGRLIANEMWARYDEGHIGIAPYDIVASIWGTLQLIPEPF